MEPRQSGLGGGIESVPAPSGGLESLSVPERRIETGNDTRLEARPEVGVVQAEVAQVAMPALPVPILAPIADSGQPTTSAIADDSTPATANDDDLIEKEWVDKAKKILAETRDDPYRRENEVSKLQVEYIRKRYGREIGTASEG